MENFTVTSILTWILFAFGVIFIVRYNWQRRYLYYYASKIPGPFALPLIGSVHLLIEDRKDIFKGVMKSVKSHPPVFKEWIGSQLYLFTSRPEDVEYILSTFLEKTPFYQFINEYTKNSLLSAPVKIWKEHRKIINHSFSPKLVNSFCGVFINNANLLIKTLGENCGKEETDLIPKIWKCTFDVATETLADLNPEHPALRNDIGNNCISWIVKAEQLMIKRLHTIWLHLQPLWKLSAMGREAQRVGNDMHRFFEKMLDLKISELYESNSNFSDLRRKRFLNYLSDDDKLSRNEIIEELILMYAASSETTAITITNVLIILGIYPDVQEKVSHELFSIFQNDNRDLTLDDLPKMEYLERVIKETMRILPTVPFIIRSITKDVQLGSYTFPAGSDVFIPIAQIHMSSDLWTDPSKFDPDRFLPEVKRHRCAYIPFSFGVRNCIGFQYAMMSIKVTLAALLRSFKVQTPSHKSAKDIELDFHVVAKPVGYKLVLERR